MIGFQLNRKEEVVMGAADKSRTVLACIKEALEETPSCVFFMILFAIVAKVKVPPLDDNRRFGDVDGCFFRNLRQTVEGRP